MSYDLIIIPREPGQDWDDALEAAEQADDEELAEANPAVWARIAARVRELLPDAVDHGDELDDEATGIQVECWGAEAAVSAPYWHTGATAERVMALMYEAAEIVAEETGLHAYDPQTGQTVEPEHLAAATALYDATAASIGNGNR
ncbi:hypothetical protein QEZ54_14300 [Catellatospora sp. KI3]|uniref:hypothetical protein n=1 Tax=Catellatospora sp. KI3 TaxID=3041620 RepID=UPI00248290B3|nr:hypothetical protein [Catellatospora sp. KI3]MDI1462141.1 hypothetical protein [Catellatospora sp. KI3]